MAAVFSRQFDHSPFDERGGVGDLPQDRLPPRHEPVLMCFYGVHNWTVLLRANKCNKKSACDSIFLPQAPRWPCFVCFAAYSAAFTAAKGATISSF